MSAQLDSVLTSVGERSSPLSQILDETEKFLSRFVAYPSEHAKIAHVLWIAHTLHGRMGLDAEASIFIA